MNKDLKNRGVNLPVLVIGGFIVLTVLFSLFTDSAIGRAPLVNKVLGILLILGGAVFARYSENLPIKNDKVLMWVQILGTMAIMALGFTVLMVWHSGALGTSNNPL
jgi:hypothetical protein